MKRNQIPAGIRPLSSGPNIDIYSVSTTTDLPLQYFPEGIAAGFPSPAADFVAETIDLNKHLIKNPSSTFIGVAKGLSMIGAGIFDNDLLIIDKSLRPAHNRIAVCVLDGEFTLKRLLIEDKKLYLQPENPDFPKIDVSNYSEFEVWGIVTNSIKKHI